MFGWIEILRIVSLNHAKKKKKKFLSSKLFLEISHALANKNKNEKGKVTQACVYSSVTPLAGVLVWFNLDSDDF